MCGTPEGWGQGHWSSLGAAAAGLPTLLVMAETKSCTGGGYHLCSIVKLSAHTEKKRGTFKLGMAGNAPSCLVQCEPL